MRQEGDILFQYGEPGGDHISAHAFRVVVGKPLVLLRQLLGLVSILDDHEAARTEDRADAAQVAIPDRLLEMNEDTEREDEIDRSGLDAGEVAAVVLHQVQMRSPEVLRQLVEQLLMVIDADQAAEAEQIARPSSAPRTDFQGGVVGLDERIEPTIADDAQRPRLIGITPVQSVDALFG